MSGHAILDSCHNCGKGEVELFVVDVSETSMSCGEIDDNTRKRYHHIHVFTACVRCRHRIWQQGEEPVDLEELDKKGHEA